MQENTELQSDLSTKYNTVWSDMSENESQSEHSGMFVDFMVQKKYSYCLQTPFGELDESVFGIEVTEDKAPFYKTTLGSALKLSLTTKATTKALKPDKTHC